jgi:tRNA dimethylallyltransferase
MIYVITGPTNTGKDRIAIELAKRLGGEIINADAFHVTASFTSAPTSPKEEDFKAFAITFLRSLMSTRIILLPAIKKKRGDHRRSLIENIPVIMLGGSGFTSKRPSLIIDLKKRRMSIYQNMIHWIIRRFITP